jgi:hypothetical protein
VKSKQKDIEQLPEPLSPSVFEEKDQRRFFISIWIFAALGSFLLLATALFLGTVAVDDELNLVRTAYDGVGRGVWGHQLVSLLLPGQLGISFAPLIFGICLYAFSTTMLIYFWGLQDRFVAYLAAFVIGCFPYFASMMTFDVVQVAYPLGFCFIIASLYPVFLKPSISSFLIGALFFSIAFSLYQGVATTFAAAFISTAGMRFVLADDKNSLFRTMFLKYLPRAVFLGVLGSILYLLMSQAMQMIIPHREWGSGYQVSLALDFWSRASFVTTVIIGLLSGWKHDLPLFSVILFFLLLFLATGAIFFISQVGKAAKMSLAICLWLAVCIAPFWLLFVQQSGLAPRSTVGLGIVYSFLFAALAIQNHRALRRFAVGFALIWCLQFVFLGNEMYYTQHFVYLSDRDTVNRIVNRIDNLPASEALPYPKPVTFVGGYEHPENGLKQFSVLGRSVFSWDNGNVWRQTQLFRHVNADGFAPTSYGKKRKSIQDFVEENNVPAWPRSGSVFVYNEEIIVVNLGKIDRRTGSRFKTPFLQIRKAFPW